MEFPWLVNDGLDSEDLSELVIHFDPIILDPVFDTGSRPAIFEATCLNFAIEAGMKALSQKSKDVLGRQMEAGMIKKL
jgi:hypothetical protein